MSIQVSGGVAASFTSNAINVSMAPGCPEFTFYETAGACRQRFDAASLNAMLSELAGLATLIPGTTYNCNSLSNLSTNLSQALPLNARTQLNPVSNLFQVTLDMADGSELNATLPIDESRPNLAAFGPSDYGLSAGQWNKATNRAMTVAEVALDSAEQVSVTPASMSTVWTNRAAQGGLGGLGVMNVDGTLGNYSATPLSQSIQFVLNNFNGASMFYEFAGGEDIFMFDGNYPGQRLRIQWIQTTTGFAEMIVRGRFNGVLRNFTEHAIRALTNNGGVLRPVYVRDKEVWDMVWTGDEWSVSASGFNMASGVNFTEQEDGFATINGVGTNFLAGVSQIIQVIPVPLASANYLISYGLFSATGVVAGAVESPISIDSSSLTANSFRAFNGTGNPPLSWHYVIHRARLDYTAL